MFRGRVYIYLTGAEEHKQTVNNCHLRVVDSGAAGHSDLTVQTCAARTYLRVEVTIYGCNRKVSGQFEV